MRCNSRGLLASNTYGNSHLRQSEADQFCQEFARLLTDSVWWRIWVGVDMLIMEGDFGS